MKALTALPPYTQWNLLDNLIVEIAAKGNLLCNNPSSRISKDRFYNALVDLLCGAEAVEVLKTIEITRPLYPYILLTYYLMFHRKDLKTATYLYMRMLSRYKPTRVLLDTNEELSLRVLGKVLEEFHVMRKHEREEYRSVLRKFLVLLISKLEENPAGDIECGYPDEWGCLLKELIVAHLSPDLDKSLEKLKGIKEIVKEKRRSYEDIDEEIMDGYNLFTDGLYTPIYTFLERIVEREIERLEGKYEEIQKLLNEERKILERIEYFTRLQRRVHVYFGQVRSAKDAFKLLTTLWPSLMALVIAFNYSGLFTSIFVAVGVLLNIFLLYLPHIYRRKLKKIRSKKEEVAEFNVEEVSKVIWSL